MPVENDKQIVFGLIGYPLSHSFSKKYFTEKFAKEHLKNCQYLNFELQNIKELTKVFEENPQLKGLNVTIPYKHEVMPFLDKLDISAQKVGAVNVIKINEKNEKVGYNSDYYGFLESLKKFFPEKYFTKKALILGNGGAAKAVKSALEELKINYQFVSRSPKNDFLSYENLDENLMKNVSLIVNTTPLGMFPTIENCPNIPYQFLTEEHFLYDLIYNPETTLFMQKGLYKGAKAKNGLEMLILQAEKSWEIWNELS